MNRHSLVVLAGICLLFVAGCSSTTAPPLEPPTQQGETGSANATRPGQSLSGSGIEEQGIREPGAFGDVVTEGRTSGPMLPVYFDFDSYEIKDDMKRRMDDNAAFLLQNPGVKIEIQGNCDSRGTTEYNIALGEKRAMAAKKYLVRLGVAPDRMDVVSFGEERPLDTANTPEAWARNRRDDFVITGR